MNYLKNLNEGFYLEDLKVLVPWKANQEEVLRLLQNYKFKNIEDANFNYCGISVNSKFLNSESVALITFNFVKKELKSVNISFPLFGNNVEQSFDYTQHFLEEKLGKPTNSNLFNFQSKLFKWKFKNVIVKHEMFESFSWRETLEIATR